MQKKQDDEHIVEIVRRALSAGMIRYSVHALQRMEERNVTVADVESVIKYGERSPKLDQYNFEFKYWRYVIREQDVDGRDLAISIDIEDAPKTMIVTVMLIDPFVSRSI